MPNAETQVYWHNLPVQTPPWSSTNERNSMWQRSMMIGGTISPLDDQLRYDPNLADKEAHRVVINHVCYQKNLGPRSLTVEPRLSVRCTLSTMLQHLSQPPLTVAECDDIISDLRRHLTQADSPMVNFVESLSARRGLVIQLQTRDNIRHRSGCFMASELTPHERALLIVSRTAPMAVVGIGEWLPKTSHSGKLIHHGALRQLCPSCEPQPWHRRTRNIFHFSYSETLTFIVSRGASVSSKSSSTHRSSTTKAVPAASPTNNGKRGRDTDDGEEDTRSVTGSSSSSGVDEEGDTTDSDDDHNLAAEDCFPDYSSKQAAKIELEESPHYNDPFVNLPMASLTIVESAQQGRKLTRRNSRATWTQQLLQAGASRRQLYNLAHTQSQSNDYDDL